MCGIAGILLEQGSARESHSRIVSAMIDAQAHRGPDASGCRMFAGGVLGHRRLAILDLSEAGRQPLSNEDGTVWLTYNGEVYNYRELHAELVRDGHQFRSASDTEVIVHGYEQWGIDGLLERLRGMYAFALYDERARQAGDRPFAYLVRDRVGIKPLYFKQSAEGLTFASEVRAVRSAVGDGGVDSEAVTGFLLFGSVPFPRTYRRGIECLGPGHYLAFGGPGGLKVKRYWDLGAGGKPQKPLGEVLRETVEGHLLSDVPLGIFLSGGMDSAGLVAIASKLVERKLVTLTITFPEAEFSERDQAREFATAYGTDHREVPVGDQDFVDELPRILKAMDQPTADGVNTYFVSQAARKAGLTVVLSGLGGDEVFLGYPHYKRLADPNGMVGKYWQAPAAARRLVETAAGWYGRWSGQEKWSRIEFLGRLGRQRGLYLMFRGFYGPGQVCRLLGIGSRELYGVLEQESAALPQRAQGADLEEMQYLEFKRYLHDQLLRDSDVFSMAHSLELRVPYLDHELVEAALAEPTEGKLSAEVNKPELLRALGDPLIEQAARRPKRGFTFPFAHWMRRHAGVLAEQAAASGVLEKKEVSRLWDEFGKGRLHWSRAWATVAVAATCG